VHNTIDVGDGVLCGQVKRSESGPAADNLKRAPDPIALSLTDRGAVGRDEISIHFRGGGFALTRPV